MAAKRQHRIPSKDDGDENIEEQPSLVVKTIPFHENDPISKQLQDLLVRNMQQAHDSNLGFRKLNKGPLTPLIFEKCPAAPTAQLYSKAFHHFQEGWSILHRYKKHNIENEEDMDQLRQAFGSDISGEISMQDLFSQFPPPENTKKIDKRIFNARPKRQKCDVILSDFQFLK